MVKTVDLAELERAHAEGALVVDVREPDEYASGHVPGARSVPLDSVPDRLGELPKDQPVYVVCKSGGRSAKGAEVMAQAGLDARSVDGGTAGWIESGRPVETGGPA